MDIGLRVRMLYLRSRNRGIKRTIKTTSYHAFQFAKHSTPRKLFNLAASKAQKYLRRDRLASLPYRYFADPLNLCNLRCPLCPTGTGSLKRHNGKMSFDQYQSVVDQIAPYAYFLQLYNWGEPLLHTRICDMIEYATRRNIIVKISSNLNYLTPDLARRLVASGLDDLMVSIDGATQETYAQYRRRGNLEKVVENMRLLVTAKKEAKSSTPFITVRALITRHNEHEIGQIRQLAQQAGADSFSTSPIFIDTESSEQRKEWLPQDEQASYYSYSAGEMENVWACADLWESMTINWDGGIAPCCWLQDPAHDFENAFATPIKDIWNSEAYVVSRQTFQPHGPRDGLRPTICNTCKGKPKYLHW